MQLRAFMKEGDFFWRKLNKVLAIISGAATLALILLVVLDVSLRYLFDQPIPGGNESTELLLPYIVFLAMSYTLAAGGHVRVSIVLDRLPPRFRYAAEILDSVVGAAFFGILTYYAWLHFWESLIILEFMMAPIKLPWWVGKFAMPVGLFAIFIQFILKAFTYRVPSK